MKEKKGRKKDRRRKRKAKRSGGGRGIPTEVRGPSSPGLTLLTAPWDPVSHQACSLEALKLPLPCGRPEGGAL